MATTSAWRRATRISIAAAAAALLCFAAAPADAIVGGTPAASGQWPWMVAVLDLTEDPPPVWQQFCGGVVIAPRRVLTAAHCAAGFSASDVAVLVGRTRLTAGGGRRIKVKAISIEPKWVDATANNLDAAILTLATDAGVAPLRLASTADAAAWPAGTLASVIGWGRLNAKRTPAGDYFYADRLRQLEVPVQSDDACEGVFGIGIWEYPYQATHVICAGTGDGKAGTCNGDSGGPLVVETPTGWLDVGIVVGNTGCAAHGYFDLYTRVDAIRSFALGASPSAQPDVIRAPRIVGALRRGHVVRCTRGRWRGAPTHISVSWTRPGNRKQKAIAHGRRHTVTRSDQRRGLRCSVTARNRAGFATAFSRVAR